MSKMVKNDTLFMSQMVENHTIPFGTAHTYIAYVRECCPGPVHTTPEKNENGGLFVRLGLPSVLISHENRALRKRSSSWRNLKTPALRFRVDRKHFVNGAFRT